MPRVSVSFFYSVILQFPVCLSSIYFKDSVSANIDRKKWKLGKIQSVVCGKRLPLEILSLI